MQIFIAFLLNGKQMRYSWIMALTVLLGCSDGTNSQKETRAPGCYKENVSLAIRDMKPTDVIVRVNGVEITKADYSAALKMAEALFRYKKRLGATGDDRQKSVAKHLRNVSRILPLDLMQREVMRQGAVKAGVTVLPECRTSVRRRSAENIGCKPGQLDSLEKKIGAEAYKSFLKVMEEDALVESLYVRESTNSLYSVTEDEFRRCEKQVMAFNRRADDANAKKRNKALAFRKQVLEGADFAELGKKKAELHPDYAEFWDSYQLGEFADEENALRKWLLSAKAGDVSEPIDLDDGLAVVKLLKIEKIALPEGFEEGSVEEYHLARCTFNAYERCNEVSREQITRFILGERRQEVAKAVGVRLAKQSVIEYPNGDDFFPEKKKKKKTAVKSRGADSPAKKEDK